MRVLAPKTAYPFLIILMILNMPTFAGWSVPVRISQPGDCWDPQIIASGDTLHVVYENTGAGYVKISYVRSTDGGETWSQPIRLTERRGHTFYPRIMQNGQHLMALWKQEFNTGYYIYNIGYTISDNGGASWDSAQYIFDHNWMGMQNMAAAGMGPDVDVIIGVQVAYDFIFFDIHSTNFGSSWTDTIRVFSCNQSDRPDMAQTDSVIHLVWDGAFVADTTWEVYYTRSLNGGLNWSQNLLLSTPDQHGSQMPAVSLDESGEVSIAWMDGKYSPYMLTGDILMRSSQDGGATWGPERQATSNHYAWASDIEASGDTIHLAWEDERHGLFHSIIQYAKSTDGGATWSEPYWIDSMVYNSSENPALSVSDGRVYAVWNGYRAMPDSSALYFSYSPYEPDAVRDSANANIPTEIELSVYPNPFNSSTIISFSNLKDDELKIFDIKGSLVRILRSEQKENGSVIWDATDNIGQKMSSGIYFAEARSQNNSAVIKLIYLK